MESPNMQPNNKKVTFQSASGDPSLLKYLWWVTYKIKYLETVFVTGGQPITQVKTELFAEEYGTEKPLTDSINYIRQLQEYIKNRCIVEKRINALEVNILFWQQISMNA